MTGIYLVYTQKLQFLGITDGGGPAGLGKQDDDGIHRAATVAAAELAAAAAAWAAGPVRDQVGQESSESRSLPALRRRRSAGIVAAALLHSARGSG